MRGYRKRTDNNHQAVIDEFRKFGCSVLDLSRVAKGCPDLLVAIDGHNILVEVKSDRGVLTPDQATFFSRWQGRVEIVRSLDDVHRLIGQSPSKNCT